MRAGARTYLAVVRIGIFYALTGWGCLAFFGADHAQTAAQHDTVNLFNTAVSALLGKIFADTVVVLLITATLACMLSIQNIAARYGFSLARDRALPRALGDTRGRSSDNPTGEPELAPRSALVSSRSDLGAFASPWSGPMHPPVSHTGTHCRLPRSVL